MLSLSLTLPNPALALRVQAGLESQTNSELEQNLSQGSPTQSSAGKPQKGSASGREEVSRRAFLKAAVAAAVPSVQTPSEQVPSPQRSIAPELLPEELMRLTPTFLKRGLDNAPSGYYVAVVGEGEQQRVVTGTAFGLELDRAFEANREEIVEGTVYGMADWIADAAIDYGHDRDWVKALGEVLWNVTTEFNKMAVDPREAFSNLDLSDRKLDVRENRLPLGLIFDSGKEGSKVYIVTADGRILHRMDVAQQLGELVKKGVLRKGTEKVDVARALREALPGSQYESLEEGDEAEKLVKAEKSEKREKIAERKRESVARQLQRTGLKALIKTIIQEKAKKSPASPSAAGLEEKSVVFEHRAGRQPYDERKSLATLGIPPWQTSLNPYQAGLIKSLIVRTDLQLEDALLTGDSFTVELTAPEAAGFLTYLYDLQQIQGGFDRDRIVEVVRRQFSNRLAAVLSHYTVASRRGEFLLDHSRQLLVDDFEDLLDAALKGRSPQNPLTPTGLVQIGGRWYQRVPPGGQLEIPVAQMPEQGFVIRFGETELRWQRDRLMGLAWFLKSWGGFRFSPGFAMPWRMVDDQGRVLFRSSAARWDAVRIGTAGDPESRAPVILLPASSRASATHARIALVPALRDRDVKMGWFGEVPTLTIYDGEDSRNPSTGTWIERPSVSAAGMEEELDVIMQRYLDVLEKISQRSFSRDLTLGKAGEDGVSQDEALIARVVEGGWGEGILMPELRWILAEALVEVGYEDEVSLWKEYSRRVDESGKTLLADVRRKEEVEMDRVFKEAVPFEHWANPELYQRIAIQITPDLKDLPYGEPPAISNRQILIAYGLGKGRGEFYLEYEDLQKGRTVLKEVPGLHNLLELIDEARLSIGQSAVLIKGLGPDRPFGPPDLSGSAGLEEGVTELYEKLKSAADRKDWQAFGDLIRPENKYGAALVVLTLAAVPNSRQWQDRVALGHLALRLAEEHDVPRLMKKMFSHLPGGEEMAQVVPVEPLPSPEKIGHAMEMISNIVFASGPLPEERVERILRGGVTQIPDRVNAADFAATGARLLALALDPSRGQLLPDLFAGREEVKQTLYLTPPSENLDIFAQELVRTIRRKSPGHALLNPPMFSDVSPEETAGMEEAGAARALAAERWTGVMVTPAYPDSRKLLPVFADRGTFSAIPLAIRGELGVLALAASGLEEAQLKEFLDEMGADPQQYAIWRLDRLGWTASEAVAMAGLEFSAYRILPVESSRPDWLQQLLAGLEEAGILPLDDLEPAFQATERYFGGFV